MNVHCNLKISSQPLRVLPLTLAGRLSLKLYARRYFMLPLVSLGHIAAHATSSTPHHAGHKLLLTVPLARAVNALHCLLANCSS